MRGMATVSKTIFFFQCWCNLLIVTLCRFSFLLIMILVCEHFFSGSADVLNCTSPAVLWIFPKNLSSVGSAAWH